MKRAFKDCWKRGKGRERGRKGKIGEEEESTKRVKRARRRENWEKLRNRR